MPIDRVLASRLPEICTQMMKAKTSKNLSWEKLAQTIGRDEIATAGIFYGQVRPSKDDLEGLSSALGLSKSAMTEEFHEGWCPDRGKLVDLPPRDPTIYRLFEIVQNYGYPLKEVIQEKFGDGIMSAITFSAHVDREEDDKGAWVNIKLRGKFLPYSRF